MKNLFKKYHNKRNIDLLPLGSNLTRRGDKCTLSKYPKGRIMLEYDSTLNKMSYEHICPSTMLGILFNILVAVKMEKDQNIKVREPQNINALANSSKVICLFSTIPLYYGVYTYAFGVKSHIPSIGYIHVLAVKVIVPFVQIIESEKIQLE